MWVAQLGRDVELELLLVLNGRVAEPDALDAAALEGLLHEQRLERRVERLEHVLAHDRLAKLDRVLQSAKVVRLRELDDLQAGRALHVADPLVRLALRVDHERPAPRDALHDRIVNRVVVRRKALQDPAARLHRLADDGLQRKVFRHGHPFLNGERLPARDRLLAVRDEEGAEVRDHARRDQDVAEQVVELWPELSRDLAPAHPLAAQAAHELLGALKLVVAVLVLALERCLLGVELGELVLHVLELVKNNLELRLLGRKALHCLGVLALRDRELRLLWGDHLRDAVVDLHREDPTAKPLGSRRALGRRLGREHLHGLVLLADDFHDLRIDVVLVVRLERVDEHLDVAHHLLGRAEEVICFALAATLDTAASSTATNSFWAR